MIRPLLRVLILLLNFGLLLFSSTIVCADQIQDFRGRTLRLDPTPQRIVALMPALAEAIIDLGAGSRLIGAPEYTTIPQVLQKRIQILGPYTRLSAELIYSLKPDAVIASMDGNDQAVVKQLDSLGVKTIVVNTTSLKEILSTLEILTQLTAMKGKQSALIQDLKNEMNKKPKKFKDDRAPQVFVQIGWDPLISISDQTFIGEMISKIGGINLFSKSTDKYPRINPEEVIARKPDVIILCRLTPVGHEVEKAIAFWKQFPQIPAVASGRIHIMPMNWLTKPGFSLIKGFQELRRIL